MHTAHTCQMPNSIHYKIYIIFGWIIGALLTISEIISGGKIILYYNIVCVI